MGLFNMFKNKEEEIKKEDKLSPVDFLRKLIDRDNRFENIQYFEDCYQNAEAGFLGPYKEMGLDIKDVMRDTNKYHLMEDYVAKNSYNDAMYNLLNIYNKCLVGNLNYYSGMFPNGELMVDTTKYEDITKSFTSAELIFVIVLLNFICEKISGYRNNNFKAYDYFTKVESDGQINKVKFD